VFVYFVSGRDFVDQAKPRTDAEKLIIHREKDISMQEQAWKAKLKDLKKTESFVKFHDLANKNFPTKVAPTVSWLYTAPKPDNTDRTLYQTVLIGDTVVMLGTVFEKTIEPGEVRSFFSRILESVTLLPPQKQATPPIQKPGKRTAAKRVN
jgi:hypothetical protein